MRKMSLLQKIERQVEKEGDEWKRKRMEELIKEIGEDQADVFPPEKKKTDENKKEDN